MNESAKVVVVGAGIAGLRAAGLLTNALDADNVLVLEASELPGGTARTESVDGFICDRGTNGFLDKEPRTLQWADELGLTDSLIRADEAAARRFILRNDRLVEVVGPPGFFFAPILSWRGKARLAIEPFVKKRTDPAPESIWDFAARRIGPEAADTLVSAMVLGVFGGDAKKLSLEHCFPVMAEMERDYGSLTKAMLARKRAGGGGGPAGPRGTLTSFDGGIGVLCERAAQKLGERLRLGHAVSRLESRNGGWRLNCTNDVIVDTEQVILASPAHRCAEIVKDFAPNLSRALASIEHSSLAVVCTAYPVDAVGVSVDGFGFLIPPNQKKRALGCIWTSSVFPGFTKDGWVFLRTMVGGARDPEAVNLSDAELLEVIHRDIHPVMKIDADPGFVQIFRHPRGIPQYALNHGSVLEAVDAAETQHPGLALAGNAYRGVSMNDCIVSAHRAVERILSGL